MINSITGIVEILDNNTITVSNNDIEYIVFCSTVCISQLVPLQKQKILTYLHISENEMSMFGFLDKKERDMFLLLIKVNGIGPKQTVKILSSSSYFDIANAIASSDEEFLSKINGIGKKTSQKIILTLSGNKQLLTFDINPSNPSKKKSNLSVDIIDALVSMGFDKKKVLAVLKSIPEGLSDEELLKSAIINLSK